MPDPAIGSTNDGEHERWFGTPRTEVEKNLPPAPSATDPRRGEALANWTRGITAAGKVNVGARNHPGCFPPGFVVDDQSGTPNPL